MSFKDMLDNFPQPKVLDNYICEGCGQLVNVTEMAIAGGPDKGKVEQFTMGCKCKDRELAQGVIENERKAKMNHFRGRFDQSSLVNASLKKATFVNYEPPTRELAQAKSLLEGFIAEYDPAHPQNLLVFGSYGTGKSHLTYAAAKELLAKGHSALFLSVPKLLTKIKESFGQSANFSESELLDFVATVDLLVLDDLGAEYTNMRNGSDNWVWTKLFEVMDSRSGKSTIYTTNLTPPDLEAKIGTRNFSRVMDDVQILKMNGVDYRRKAFLGGN